MKYSYSAYYTIKTRLNKQTYDLLLKKTTNSMQSIACKKLAILLFTYLVGHF